ncbi:MAG: hypothetical protein LZF61_08930 [Nitrosomonas sp.]|nr:MAG: hypothetical protein LZF61_08930 [Nitrosomonas sp.]
MTVQIVSTGIAAVLAMVLVLQTGAAHAHGKVAMEDDNCMRRIGENMIHLSAYQPQLDEEGHYCTDIPKAGNAILVIDLVDPALREMPIAVKIGKGGKVGDGEIISHLRTAMYGDGVISTQTTFDQGPYYVQVTAEGIPPLHYEYHLRVEMVNYANVFRAAIGPTVGILLTLLLGYKLLRSKRFKAWLAARGKKKAEDESI